MDDSDRDLHPCGQTQRAQPLNAGNASTAGAMNSMAEGRLQRMIVRHRSTFFAEIFRGFSDR